ncbi:MAG: phenylalanine--tRNA ligase subunit beta [Armatimonadetes bacterium]|nr:phenylalanine--tRNA ligase subunit beta [Armatimonadota bacterium]
MRIPVDWLNEYVPNELSMRDLAYILTNVGLEVEEITEGSATTVFDIKVTPNRGDCLSVLGVARELGMALRKPVQDRKPSITEAGPAAASLVTITLDDPALCPRYSARLVRGVKIGPSPEWAQRRLGLSGLRPINNVVDATNLVMLELGQPLHAFDYQLLAREDEDVPEIVVRRARSGERLFTIDDEERELTPELLLITDASGPIAVAGVMGGATTEINDGTTEVLLESAHFDPITIRKGASALGMSTEASYRFERTVDPGGTIRALDRACELIAEFCEAEVEIATGVADAYPQPYVPALVSLRPARVNELLGLELTAEQMRDYLRLLDLEVEEGEELVVRAPTFRQDLKEEIDLVEEVARVHGYENIPEAVPHAASEVAGLPPELAFERQVRHLLRGLGFSESVTSSLEGAEGLDRLGLREDDPRRRVVALSNWKTIDRSQLRTTLLTSLMEVVSHNKRHDIDDVAIFDVGCVYLEEGGDGLPRQPQHLGLAVTGRMARGVWQVPRQIGNWDFYGLKGVVENILTAIGRPRAEFVPDAPPPWRPGHAAGVEIEGQPVGHFGELRTEVREEYDLVDPVFVAEFDLDVLGQLAVEEVQYQQVSRYPAVRRDVAFLLPREMDSKRAEKVISEAAGAELESLMLFDAFEGQPLPKGKRNLAFSLTFRSATQTLTDEEVEGAMVRVREALRTELGAEIRE